MTKKISITAVVIAALILVVSLMYPGFIGNVVKARTGHYVTCPMFKGDYYAAQAAWKTYKENPTAYPQYKNLDKDHDGIACNSLYKK